MLNTDSRRRSCVGRISFDAGDAMLRPRSRPPTTRISVLRRQIAFAVIAALGLARRAIAIGLGFVTRPLLVAAAALNHDGAALAVFDLRTLDFLVVRLGTKRRAVAAHLRALVFTHRLVELRTGHRGDLFAVLLAQHTTLDLLDLPLGNFTELERAIRHTDQAIHLETEMRHHVPHFAILAFADREHQPDVSALVALQRRIDRAVFNAIDLDAGLQFI